MIASYCFAILWGRSFQLYAIQRTWKSWKGTSGLCFSWTYFSFLWLNQDARCKNYTAKRKDAKTVCWHTVSVRESESRRFYAAVTEKLKRQWLHAHIKSVLILNAIRVLLFAPELSTKGVPGWVALLQVETQWPWFLLPVTSSFPSSKAKQWRGRCFSGSIGD